MLTCNPSKQLLNEISTQIVQPYKPVLVCPKVYAGKTQSK